MVRKTHLILLLILVTISAKSQFFTVSPIKTNLNGNVFAPAYFGKFLVVACDQKNRLYKTILDEKGGEPVDLYQLDTTSSFSASEFSLKFKTLFNDGPISFNKAGTSATVSMNLRTEVAFKNNNPDKNSLGLYYSNFENGEWGDLLAMEFNSFEYSCTHPSMNEEGNLIVFSSNMPKGYGGYDLYFTKFENNKWSAPVNLGSAVNSENNEVFPSIINNSIYFSSDRIGFGGLDVYSFAVDKPKEKAKLIPKPINSEKDDFGLITADKFNSGYFASNRNGKDEIWSFNFNYPDFNRCDSLVIDNFCFTLYEENAFELNEVQSLLYQWKINNDTIPGISIEYCFPGPGQYEITLDIYDSIIKKTYYDQAYYYIELEYEIQPFIEAPDTVKLNENFQLSAEKSNLPDTKVDEYYWFINDGTKLRGITANHSFNQPGTYEIRLGIIGKQNGFEVTDCSYRTIVCLDEYTTKTKPSLNLIPSSKEDTTVVQIAEEYFPTDTTLVIFSIEVMRTHEQLDEDSFDFKKLSAFGQVQLEYIQEEDFYIYYVGQWNSITAPHETWKQLIEHGYVDAKVKAFTMEEFNEVPLDEIFIIENIQFETNKWDITPLAEDELIKLVQILVLFPDIMIEIHAHTDAIGRISDNTLLSENRAKSVKAYLVENNISATRIKLEWHGELIPIADNTTEEGKLKNRRVEFKLNYKSK